MVGNPVGRNAPRIRPTMLLPTGLFRLASRKQRWRPGTAGTAVQVVPLPAPTKSRPAGTSMSAETGPLAAPLAAMRFTPMLNVAPFTTRSGTSSVGTHAAPGSA